MTKASTMQAYIPSTKSPYIHDDYQAQKKLADSGHTDLSDLQSWDRNNLTSIVVEVCYNLQL